ncbi:MAG: HAD domain-containing protein [Acidobacteriaceae bacterium]
MSDPILCLDFDGVVHSYTSGWKGARVIPDDPVPGALEFMATALVDGFDVVIHSSRARYFGGIRAMRRWLKEKSGLLWYETLAGPGLEDIRFSRWKPPAMVTLDDRAITFSGKFPELRSLREFKPWNKP